MKEVKLTDELIIPVMLKHDIEREEAERRLQLLFQSGIMSTGSPDDPESQQMIDDFLAQDSEALAITVLFEKTLTECLDSKEFVKQYDRLTHRDLAKVIREINAGKNPKNAHRELDKFSKFVRSTVFARLEQKMEEDFINQGKNNL